MPLETKTGREVGRRLLDKTRAGRHGPIARHPARGGSELAGLPSRAHAFRKGRMSDGAKDRPRQPATTPQPLDATEAVRNRTAPLTRFRHIQGSPRGNLFSTML